MLEDNFVSRKELGLIYEGVLVFNQRAADGIADRPSARIITFSMIKALAIRMKFPDSPEKAFNLVHEVALWFVSHVVSLSGDDRVSLVQFYIRMLAYNLGGNVRMLIARDKRFDSVFGSDGAVEAFVAASIRKNQSGKGVS